MKIYFKKLTDSYKDEAVNLVLKVFLQFEAPDYNNEGIDSFKNTVMDKKFSGSLTYYGAFDGRKIIGVIATRNNGSHIALFFVDTVYQGQGIGRALFDMVLSDTYDTVTVNSSPFAVPVYEKLGFCAADCENVKDGIRFTPMIYKRKDN